MTHTKIVTTHSLQCSRCGGYVSVPWNVNRTTCEWCRQEREREKYEGRKRRRGRTDKPAHVKILYDPDQENGFSAGAAFLIEEHQANRKLGVYTPGTIIDVAGRRVEICGSTNYTQWERTLT